MRTVRIAAIAVFGVLLLSIPSQILAQQTQPQQPAQQKDVNDTQLRSFAKVYVQIQKIRQTYEPQLKQAKTPEEGRQIETEEVLKIHQAIEQEGMSDENYRRIIDIVRADEGVRKKLLGFIDEEKQKP
jgi:hypothetical protein